MSELSPDDADSDRSMDEAMHLRLMRVITASGEA